MSQNSLTLPTSGLPGLTMILDVNAANDSLARLFSGPAAPTASGLGLASLAGVPWHDTAANTLKLRDQADSAWITIGTFDEVAKIFVPAGVGSAAAKDIGTSGSTVPLRNQGGQWDGAQVPAAHALGDAATVAWDASLGNLFTLTTTAVRTIGAPTGLEAGGCYRLALTTNGFTPAWASAFKFPGGVVPASLAGFCVFDFHSPDGATLHCVGQSVAEA